MDTIIMNEFETYSVFYRNKSDRCCMYTVTALSPKDAREAFGRALDVDHSNVKKITKVVKGYGMPKTTPKQHLAHQYRSCIGALKMAEFNIQRTNIENRDPKEYYRLISIKQTAIKHAQNAMRDVKDLFTRFGLKIK